MLKKKSILYQCLSTAPLMKNNSFLTGHRLAVQRKTTTTKDVHLISFAAFSRLLSLSPDRGSERGLTDMANEHAQESDGAMVGPPAPSSLSRSTFCPQQLSHKKNFFRDFSSEVCP